MQSLSEPIRAAQYVRMSTDQQIYSPANQIDARGYFQERLGISVPRFAHIRHR